MNCKYNCGRTEKHSHELLMLNGELVPDDAYNLKSEQGYMWSGEILPVYSIWVGDKKIGRVFNGQIEVNENGEKEGYNRELYET